MMRKKGKEADLGCFRRELPRPLMYLEWLYISKCPPFFLGGGSYGRLAKKKKLKNLWQWISSLDNLPRYFVFHNQDEMEKKKKKNQKRLLYISNYGVRGTGYTHSNPKPSLIRRVDILPPPSFTSYTRLLTCLIASSRLLPIRGASRAVSFVCLRGVEKTTWFFLRKCFCWMARDYIVEGGGVGAGECRYLPNVGGERVVSVGWRALLCHLYNKLGWLEHPHLIQQMVPSKAVCRRSD